MPGIEIAPHPAFPGHDDAVAAALAGDDRTA
jgi:hypothetical protein